MPNRQDTENQQGNKTGTRVKETDCRTETQTGQLLPDVKERKTRIKRRARGKGRSNMRRVRVTSISTFDSGSTDGSSCSVRKQFLGFKVARDFFCESLVCKKNDPVSEGSQREMSEMMIPETSFRGWIDFGSRKRVASSEKGLQSFSLFLLLSLVLLSFMTPSGLEIHFLLSSLSCLSSKFSFCPLNF